ncbi:response regulator [Prosthecobacter sp. SYSU 5D2]|uniref:response regulator n=1 Tax=Prosthecobacter sp. SYSU 5D2 TaxID=3134134 RepID=UPI0031FECEE9
MKRTILMIEDNEQNAYLATFLLEKHGYEVVSVKDGPSGLAVVKTMVPDYILLDIQLPGMDGYAVARELRKEASLRETPIIAVTSYAMEGDRQKSLDAGCTGYIEKPINPETFVKEVETYGSVISEFQPLTDSDSDTQKTDSPDLPDPNPTL